MIFTENHRSLASLFLIFLAIRELSRPPGRFPWLPQHIRLWNQDLLPLRGRWTRPSRKQRDKLQHRIHSRYIPRSLAILPYGLPVLVFSFRHSRKRLVFLNKMRTFSRRESRLGNHPIRCFPPKRNGLNRLTRIRPLPVFAAGATRQEFTMKYTINPLPSYVYYNSAI